MSLLGYDAGTMGNHDFDAGVDGFAAQLPHASFPILVSNYDFSQTVLEGKIPPNVILIKGGIKIGIFGLGIKLKGLVPDDDFSKVQYLEPLRIAQQQADYLKHTKRCDMVICLSHLGYQYDFNKPSDMVLARETENIDLILGGHTHTFLNEPTVVKNKKGVEVAINQVGWGGIKLGRLDYTFDKQKKGKLA